MSPEPTKGLGVWAPPRPKRWARASGCAAGLLCLWGRTPCGLESRDKTLGGGRGLVRYLGCRKQGAAPPSTLAAPPHPHTGFPVGHTEDASPARWQRAVGRAPVAGIRSSRFSEESKDSAWRWRRRAQLLCLQETSRRGKRPVFLYSWVFSAALSRSFRLFGS